ncbi:hypothetical protein [Nocardioides sp. BYT-33-1]|uniref:hypothetical protein n=1 Tax=Nocardioides sp. BYT-33-1 TaxID=3416952 RepID=UPI003F53D9C8
MKRISLSAAPAALMVVAALILAGASGSAALPGKNSIDGNDLRKNVVKSKHVKDNSLKGRDIDESTLATVPSAASAASAASLAGYQKAGIKRVGATSGATEDAARSAAPEVALFTSGAFTIYGKCYRAADSDTVFARAFIKTSENGAVFESDYDSADGDAGTFLNVGTPETDREAHYASAGNNGADSYFMHSTEIGAMSPNGTAIEAHVQVAAKNGDLPGGNGIYGAGDVCLFAGEVNQF